MRIHCFSTGRVRRTRAPSGIRRYFVQDWSDDTLPVHVFLVEHPDGLCLVDTGQTARAATPGYFPPWYPFFRLAKFELGPEDEAAARIAAAGFDPADVRWVVLTHLHTDHVGGLEAFRHAEVIVGLREWERARGLRGRLRGYLPQYWPEGLEPRVVDFGGQPVGPFAGSFDVASDGRLLFVPLPGHTRGHAGVLVRREAGPDILFAGDAAERASDLSAEAPHVASWCRREGVLILTSHDDAAGEILAEAGEPASPPP